MSTEPQKQSPAGNESLRQNGTQLNPLADGSCGPNGVAILLLRDAYLLQKYHPQDHSQGHIFTNFFAAENYQKQAELKLALGLAPNCDLVNELAIFAEKDFQGVQRGISTFLRTQMVERPEFTSLVSSNSINSARSLLEFGSGTSFLPPPYNSQAGKHLVTKQSNAEALAGSKQYYLDVHHDVDSRSLPILYNVALVKKDALEKLCIEGGRAGQTNNHWFLYLNNNDPIFDVNLEQNPFCKLRDNPKTISWYFDSFIHKVFSPIETITGKSLLDWTRELYYAVANGLTPNHPDMEISPNPVNASRTTQGRLSSTPDYVQKPDPRPQRASIPQATVGETTAPHDPDEPSLHA